MALSKIEWCDYTFNGWIGCTRVGPGCDNCYAAVSTPARTQGIAWGAGEPRKRTGQKNWDLPLRWNAKQWYECQDCGDRHVEWENENCPSCDSLNVVKTRARVFCSSLADVFDNEVDPEWRTDLFRLIEHTPNLDWLLLTKRIGNVEKMVPLPWQSKPIQHGPDPQNIYPGGWPKNVWLGATVVNQQEANRDIKTLCQIPAAVRFLSVEPMLGDINLEVLHIDNRTVFYPFHGEIYRNGIYVRQLDTYPLDWVIVGGESGHKARSIENVDWVRSIRDICAKYNVPFLFKQWGEYGPNWLNDDAGNKIPGTEHMEKMGKQIAGRTLDGRTHSEFPTKRQ